ncbi:hypothetical protein FRC07_006917 [Ceratobasidium sp. 392]|nr:hypothetical protein FRC07_006917 [Ceratobasidium sp. 392]
MPNTTPAPESSEDSNAPRGGRGKRGEFGKSVRARDCGKRFITPAPFRANEKEEEVDEEETEKKRVKYLRRNLSSNVARYEGKGPDPDEEPESGVNLSALLSRQKLEDENRTMIGAVTERDEPDGNGIAAQSLARDRGDPGVPNRAVDEAGHQEPADAEEEFE